VVKEIQMKGIFALTLAVLALGAQAQITQTSYQVNLSLTAPSVCTAAAPCTYLYSRATVAGGLCPTTASSYATLGSTASQVVSYSDNTVTPGGFYCYVAQTTQGGATSGPSAPFAIAVPGNPPTPGTPTGATTTVTVTVTTIP
jgi:hypothetical protein